MEGMRLIHGDCIEEMQKLIDEGVKVDMVLTDPPYGTTACKWDNVIDFGAMWRCIRGLRNDNTPIVLFGSEPFSSMLRCSNIKEFKYDWIWKKSRPSGFPNAKRQPLRYHETISVFCKGAPPYNPIMVRGTKVRVKGANKGAQMFGGESGLNSNEYVRKTYTDYYPSTIIEYANPNHKSLHPTQKPVALLEYLIKTYTNEGDTVLDFTMGSGSTAIACMNTNRKFIGIELDDKYFEIAKNRIESEYI